MTSVELVALLVTNVSDAPPPGKPDSESATLPLKPLVGVIFTGSVPPFPGASVRLVFPGVIVKPGVFPGTTRLRLVDAVTDPEVPVMVSG